MRTTMKSLVCRLFPALLAVGGVPVAPGVAHAADYDVHVVKSGPTRATLSWKAERGQQYWVCWKLDAASGDVCGNGSQQAQVSIWDSNYANGRLSHTLHSLDQCDREYKVRIRRTLVAFDTHVFWFPC